MEKVNRSASEVYKSGSMRRSPKDLLTANLLLLLLTTPAVRGMELGQCSVSLGMETGDIKDSAISSSSAYDSSSVGPQHGRLRNNKQGGAWCPKHMVSRDAKEYLEINLQELHVISGGRTQGRYGNGQGQEYAEEYMIEYWRPTFLKWVRWKNREGKELLTGNTNTFTIVDQRYDPPIVANKIRFLPYSDHVRTVCMRVEILGCKWTEGIQSYSMPQGNKYSGSLSLIDSTFDGRQENGYLYQGLGQLVDGQLGDDNFKLDISGHGAGYEWIGWRNDAPGLAGLPLEIVFEFDKVRNFSAVHLHTNNLFNKDIQVFSQARAFFGFSSTLFAGEPVHFSYMPDLVLTHARNVTIKLHQRVARCLKLQLYFASRWILLSEVSFDSVVVTGNFTETEEPGEEADEEKTPERGGGGEPSLAVPDSGKEYPLQRDEVKSTFTKINRNFSQIPTKTGSGGESDKHYIGFVIGVLAAVILILVAAIVFVVFRSHTLKILNRDNGGGVGDVEGADRGDKTTLQGEKKLGSETYEKPPIYQDNYKSGLSLGQQKLNCTNSAEVPDLVSQEYSSRNSDWPNIRMSAAFMKHFSNAPNNPSAPTKLFYKTEEDPSPAYSPSLSLRRHKRNRHFMLPSSPDKTEHEAAVERNSVVEVFPRDQLRIIEKIGDSQFGDVHLCEFMSSPCASKGRGECKYVAVHTLRTEGFRKEFNEEVRALAKLKHGNIAELLGACLSAEPICAIREYALMGDLCQFLQDHVADTATTPLAMSASTLSYGCLIYMATQIASAMKYLESLNYVHKDLATRNCLVGKGYLIKVSDLGSYKQLYSSDYCQIGSSRPLPIRWMAWESFLLGKYSSKGDVWSFAVTLWEILTFAREQPFEDLSDDKIIENITHFYKNNGKEIYLNAPINCPKEIFDLMCECWQRNESDRPTFGEIHLFLQRKNLGYSAELH